MNLLHEFYYWGLLTRFTARVYELLVVLRDMEKGVYERTMVEQSAEDDTEGEITGEYWLEY